MESHPRSHKVLEEEKIDAVGHILRVPGLKEGDEDFNPKVANAIDVLKPEHEGDRAYVYQMWTISQFAEHPVAMEALQRFNLAGETEDKENWTQLLEHIAGVAATAVTIQRLLEKYGAEPIDVSALKAAALYELLEKPDAVEVGREAALGTAALVHDIAKPAELAAGAGGLENSLDNPVIRDGALWRWLHDRGVDEAVIIAAQNTGRDDRLYSDYDAYPEDMVKKAMLQREALAEMLGVSIDEVNAMTPTERRQASIEAKDLMSGILGFADALSLQARFQGATDSSVDSTRDNYLERKKDLESFVFFTQDWAPYYKLVRLDFINRVPKENREAFEAELNALTQERVFNDTILPDVLGDTNPEAMERLRYPDAA